MEPKHVIQPGLDSYTGLRHFLARLRGAGELTATIPGVLGLYRFVSWFLTSLFYFLGSPPVPWSFKLGVTVSLFGAAWAAHRVYMGGRGKEGLVKNLVGMEVLGIGLLLLPTGGLDSPFIWYAVNPLLTAAAELPVIWCWLALAGFIVVITTLTFTVPGVPGTVRAGLAAYADLLLILILLTLGAQLFTGLLRRSQAQARLLEKQRGELEESLELISSLYRLVEVISTRDKVQDVLDLFAQYTQTLTGAGAVMLGLGPDYRGENGPPWAAAGSADILPPEKWRQEFEARWQEMEADPRLWEKMVGEGEGYIRVVYLPIRSPNRIHGILAAALGRVEAGNKEKRRVLGFLADLAAVALERCSLEELSRQLLVVEEQDRIANEIHDGVAQYLFSIACGCHSLQVKWGAMPREEIQAQLKVLVETAQRAARELRASIYRLSPRHQGKAVFVQGVRTYLDELARLNNVEAVLEVDGSEEVLSPALRKAFYRIIREATGNALRHGACSSLKVSLRLSPIRSFLVIEDNGRGFDIKSDAISKGKGLGLGLHNMEQLAQCFNGELMVESQPGQGTVVRCVVPR